MMIRGLLIVFICFASASVKAQEIKKIKITDLEKTIKESKEPLIINFWATYCIPCLKEMPYFQEQAKAKNIKLLLVSVDLEEAYPAEITSTAKKLKLTAPISWLNETDADYFCPKVDSSWSGGLPSTLFINNSTGYRKFIEDEISKDDFGKNIHALLDPKKK
jgi:thiol-disulfide isomerase/thioredoxin